jgi:hypothetical protein
MAAENGQRSMATVTTQNGRPGSGRQKNRLLLRHGERNMGKTFGSRNIIALGRYSLSIGMTVVQILVLDKGGGKSSPVFLGIMIWGLE